MKLSFIRRGSTLILAISLFWWLSRVWSDRLYVGAYNDDAVYILTAQSLLHGSYEDPSSPNPSIFNRFGPGFPVFLIPWVKAFAPHWSRLIIVSELLVLTCCAVLWQLGGLYLGNLSNGLWIAAFAIHPLTMEASAAVMSEPLYILLTALFFLVLHRHLLRSSIHLAWLQGILLGWILLVRPIGILLVPAALLAYGLAHRWKEAAIVFAIGLAIYLPFPLAVYHSTGTATNYAGFWRDSIPLFRTHLLDNFHRISYLLLSENLLCLPLPHRGRFIFLSWLPIGGAACLCIFGFCELYRSRPALRPLTATLGAYLLLLWLLHSVWLSIDARYFLPMLPWAMFFFIAGGSGLWRRTQKPTLFFFQVAGGVLWLTLIVRANVRAWHSAGSGSEQRFPARSIQWIRDHTAYSSLLLGPEPLLYLYTQRRGCTFLEAADREEFRYQILCNSIQYVVSIPLVVNMPLTAKAVGIRRMVEKNQRWVAEWPEAFHPVYEQKEENVRIYEVAMDPVYEAAYKNYLAAVEDLARSNIASASQRLRLCLAQDPHLAAAWTTAGISNYMQHYFSRAEHELTMALRIDPQAPLASLHLARIYAAQQRWLLARQLYSETIAAIDATDRSPEVRPLAVVELSRLPHLAPGPLHRRDL